MDPRTGAMIHFCKVEEFPTGLASNSFELIDGVDPLYTLREFEVPPSFSRDFSTLSVAGSDVGEAGTADKADAGDEGSGSGGNSGKDAEMKDATGNGDGAHSGVEKGGGSLDSGSAATLPATGMDFTPPF